MKEKRKARVITTAWGESYLNELLDITIPALLAPGNLPAFVEHFDTEFVLVTEQRDFAYVESHPSYLRLKGVCPARMVMADDLVVSRNMYGTSLTHCLHRGFEDLGQEMTEHYLLFLNSDFVLADGSYASLTRKLLDGERLVFAPSYCTNSEPVRPLLNAKINPVSRALAIPPREMAEIILNNRHNTIRSKTVNVPVFHMDISDQFYWYVDEFTLIGHQMPIALVAMRPERVYLDPVSFWDYATISMAAPNLPRCVMADSDDFLMLELRRSRTFVELMRIGRVAVEDVASALGYMTADQYEMGRFQLTLHARDLPPEIEDARSRLKAHVDKVYAMLPPPASYIGHTYWVGLIEEFNRNKSDWWHRNRPIGNASAPEPVSEFSATSLAPLPGTGGFLRRMLRLLVSDETIRDTYRRIFGTLPRVTRNHPYWACLRFVLEEIDRVRAVPGVRILVVQSENGFLHRALKGIAGAKVSIVSPYALQSRGLPDGVCDLDFCLFDLDWQQASQSYRSLYSIVRPAMRDGGRVVLHHASIALRRLSSRSVEQILPLLPDIDLSSARFTGGPWLARAIDTYTGMLELRATWSLASRILVPWWMLKVWWRARRGNAAAETLPQHEVPAHCCAVTVTTEVRFYARHAAPARSVSSVAP